MDHSIEFCGGTHLETCDLADQFVLVHEQALAAGTRRIAALTGVAAAAARKAGEDLLARIAAAADLDDADLPGAFDELNRLVDEMQVSQPVRHGARAALDSLRTRVKKARKEAASDRRGDVLEQARSLNTGDEQIVVATIEGGDKETLLAALDTVRAKRPGGAVMLLSADQDAGKVIIVAGVDPPLIEKGLKAGDWVKEAAKACGGGGGGRPDTAQAGGKDPAKMPQAMEAAQQYALEATT
jgi:alanyl-tRNA synthetase